MEKDKEKEKKEKEKEKEKKMMTILLSTPKLSKSKESNPQLPNSLKPSP